MLVLSRKVGERVVIGGAIVVTVVRAEKNQIRLGFEAPPEVGIYRAELGACHASPPAGCSRAPAP